MLGSISSVLGHGLVLPERNAELISRPAVGSRADTCFVRDSYQMLENPEKKTLLLSKGVFLINAYHVTVSLSNRNNPLALGANNSNLPRILQIFGEVFVNDVLSDNEASRKRVLSIIRQIQVRITIDMNKV